MKHLKMRNKNLQRGLPIPQPNKKAQEELVGFGLIMIVVAVILLVFLSLALKNPEKEAVESYETDSFIQAMLQFHTDCEDYTGPLDIKDLIFSCDIEESCLDGRFSCDVLDSTLREIVESSWQVSADGPVKGYELGILINSVEILNIQEGNLTNTYKGSRQPFPPKRGSLIEITFNAYA